MTPHPLPPTTRGQRPLATFLLFSVLVAAGLLAATYQRWWPQVGAWLAAHGPQPVDEHGNTAAAHDDHGHAHAGHAEANSIEISAQARKNIGLRTGPVALQSFTRYLTLPGMVVERPGRSKLEVTTPLTGIVTKIEPLEGETVRPDQVLFEIRLTHEELVQAQAEFLRTVEELDVTLQEINRLEKLAKDGGVAGKAILDRKYEQQKQEAALRSQRQALVLHGLSLEQVETILKKRELLHTLEVKSPPLPQRESATQPGFYQVQKLNVSRGQQVNAGDTLAELVDHAELFLEGNAFERDLGDIHRAVKNNQPIRAFLEVGEREPQLIDDLRILYIAPQVDTSSRSLHFYVSIPNVLEQDNKLADGRRYSSWRFRPGQRTRLQIPVETWPDKLVLPLAAVVEEGVESYVFTPNGDHFDRRTVHVEYRDDERAVIANDGAIFPGDEIALTSAKQLQLALRNKSGGGIDPHAGHNH